MSSAPSIVPIAAPAARDAGGPHHALPIGVPIDSPEQPVAPPVIGSGEPAHEDILVERDEDAAHHVLLRDLDEAAAPTLFDESGDDDERLADLAIEQPAADSNESRGSASERHRRALARRHRTSFARHIPCRREVHPPWSRMTCGPARKGRGPPCCPLRWRYVRPAARFCCRVRSGWARDLIADDDHRTRPGLRPAGGFRPGRSRRQPVAHTASRR